VYQFADVEGVCETQPAPTGALAGTTDYLSSQYPANLRLKGNTLINLNDPTSTAAPTWGLASKFRPLNLSTQVRTQLDETLGVGFSLDWVHNAAFDVTDIRRRAGTDAVLQLVERNTGLQMRVDFGRASVASAGDWQVFATWRRFERDAWIDGFTDTSWHGGGGTNYQGWQLGGLYAFDKRTSLGLRATTTRNLSDGQINLSSAPLKVDVMQLDLSTRF
jgi:long-subunit fatty acid transport protein